MYITIQKAHGVTPNTLYIIHTQCIYALYIFIPSHDFWVAWGLMLLRGRSSQPGPLGFQRTKNRPLRTFVDLLEGTCNGENQKPITPFLVIPNMVYFALHNLWIGLKLCRNPWCNPKIFMLIIIVTYKNWNFLGISVYWFVWENLQENHEMSFAKARFSCSLRNKSNDLWGI
jgi:hypothetical protein